MILDFSVVFSAVEPLFCMTDLQCSERDVTELRSAVPKRRSIQSLSMPTLYSLEGWLIHQYVCFYTFSSASRLEVD